MYLCRNIFKLSLIICYKWCLLQFGQRTYIILIHRKTKSEIKGLQKPFPWLYETIRMFPFKLDQSRTFQIERRNHNPLIIKSVIELKKLFNFEYPTRNICSIKMRYINLHGSMLIIAALRSIHCRFLRTPNRITSILYSLINSLHEPCNRVI